MERKKDTGAVFAELTALLEDAAALAAEGQRADMAPEGAIAIAAELNRHLCSCGPLLAALAV